MFSLDKNYKIIIDPNILTIPEYSAIWEKDKTTNKEFSHKIFSFLYFLCDYKSPYRKSVYFEELYDLVYAEILADVKLTVTDKARLNVAIDKYAQLQHTKSIKALESLESALYQVQKYFKEFNLDNSTDKDGAVNKIMVNAEKLPKLIVQTEQLRKKLEEELSMKDKEIRGRGATRSRELPKNKRK